MLARGFLFVRRQAMVNTGVASAALFVCLSVCGCSPRQLETDSGARTVV